MSVARSSSSRTSFRGAMTESLFDAFCFSREWHVAYPGLDAARYDRLMSRDGGLTWDRVQVKTSFSNSPRPGRTVNLRACNKKYQPGDWEYLFTVCDGFGYLIPFDEVHGKYSLTFGGEAKWEKFKIGSINFDDE